MEWGSGAYCEVAAVVAALRRQQRVRVAALRRLLGHWPGLAVAGGGWWSCCVAVAGGLLADVSCLLCPLRRRRRLFCDRLQGADACHKCSDATCVAPSCVTTVCVGASAGLAPADCAAWVDIYDATKGGQWAGCSGNRLDPCGCTAKDHNGNPRVACTGDKTHITQL